MVESFVDIEESTLIEASPETVWRLVTDIERHPEFAGPKSITKVIEFDGPVEVGARWLAHEKFGPQKFDAPSEIIEVEAEQRLAWKSFPPMKEENRGEGGIVVWTYTLSPEGNATRLAHHMEVLPPAKGFTRLKIVYAVLSLRKKQREGVLTTLANVKAAAEG